MIPAKYEPYVFSLVLSGMMSFIIAGIATFRSLGLIDGFIGLWLSSWIVSWAIAFPTVTVVAPIAKKVVHKLVDRPAGA